MVEYQLLSNWSFYLQDQMNELGRKGWRYVGMIGKQTIVMERAIKNERQEAESLS